ncbi:tetratricopeptide repeat protein [uncultured Microscilla sp.]|uniref:tetratricopeptide repeat protein n=1 Tax=uncultured Microscilla sp. TaxID=432653 RepID=UPI00262B400F|nr:tetratricopeptide repeat protein [uncultured Microscilla sp.]
MKTQLDPQTKVNTYNSLANQYRFNDSVKVAHYTTQSIRLAKSKHYTEGIADAYYNLGWINYIKNHYEKALELFKKVLALSKSSHYLEGIANAFNGIGVVHKNQGNYNQAMVYYDKSLKVKKKLNKPEILSHSYNNIGNVYQLLGEYDKALENHHKALSIRKQLNSYLFMAMSHNNIGIVHENQGNYFSALKHHQKSLDIELKLGNKSGIARSYGALGNVHKSLGNYHKALGLYEKALKINSQLSNLYGVAMGYTEMGACYQHLNDLFMAKKSYQKALKLAVSSNEKSNQASAYQGLGEAYTKQGEYKMAESYLNKAREIRTQIKEQGLLSETLMSLGKASYAQKKYKLALSFTNEGITMAKKLGRIKDVKKGVAMKAGIYEALKDYKKAYYYHQSFKQIEDSLINAKTIRQAVRLETDYKFQKYQDSLDLAQVQQSIQVAAKIKQQKLANQLQTYITLTCITFAVLLVLGFWLIQRQKRRHILQDLVLKQSQKQLLEEQMIRKEMEEIALREQLHIDEKIKEIFQINLENKDHELTKQALYLVQKQQLIETWLQELTPLLKQTKGTVRDKIQTLNKQMKKELKTTEAWNNFTQTFELAHPSFYKKLKISFPELTTYELKLSALIKLNLDTYEVAEFMNISPESARKAKLRLRKKMDLPSTDALREYFRNM